MQSVNLQERLSKILMPHAHEQTDRVVRDGVRFVHYTSGSSAMSILGNQQIWMRNATCMNDYSEMQFGLNCIRQAYHSEAGVQFQQVLDRAHAGLTNELVSRFDPLGSAIAGHTYLTCLSEHRDEEDLHGRLSMWRAYAEGSGVAIIMNNRAFVTPTDALKAWTFPVSYAGGEGIVDTFRLAFLELERDTAILAGLPREEVLNAVFDMLLFSAVSTKHIGFKEEQEWRVIYLPAMQPSNRILTDTKIVNGVPQRIHTLQMRNYPEEGFVGAEPLELIDRIIVGPTEYPVVLQEAFISAMLNLGFEDAYHRVVMSGVPLRC